MGGINRFPGWNAGARSIKFVDGDCEATVTPSASLTDSFFGLSPATDVRSLTEQTHSFRFSHDASGSNAFAYERGVQMQSLGAYNSGDLFAIRRIEGVVTFYKNGALVYTSLTPSTGRRYLACALYMGGDQI
jgi:hypothetical protein